MQKDIKKINPPPTKGKTMEKEIEHPIIFSTDMVKAILEGRKTQTRRVVKMQGSGVEDWYHRPDGLWQALHLPKGVGVGIGNPLKCPYGKIKDRLWVRENWRIESFMDGEPLQFGYKAGGVFEEAEEIEPIGYEDWFERVTIQSTEDAEKAFKKGLITQDKEGYFRWDGKESPCRWRPSIHMPRWASRITLEITDIRVERLQKINATDIKKEGIITKPLDFLIIVKFKELWNSIHWDNVFGWDTNPWVWVISFKKLH